MNIKIHTAMMTNSISLAEQKKNIVSSVKIANNASRAMSSALSSFDLVGWLASTRAIVALSEMVSDVMEESISPRFTLHLLNAQLSGIIMLTLADVDIFVRIISLLWFVTSLYMAKRAYAKM